MQIRLEYRFEVSEIGSYRGSMDDNILRAPSFPTTTDNTLGVPKHIPLHPVTSEYVREHFHMFTSADTVRLCRTAWQVTCTTVGRRT